MCRSYAQKRIYARRQLETDVDFALKIHLRVKLRLFTKIHKSAVRVEDKARRLVEFHLAVEGGGDLRLKLYLYRDKQARHRCGEAQLAQPEGIGGGKADGRIEFARNVLFQLGFHHAVTVIQLEMQPRGHFELALNALYLCAALFRPSAQVKVQDPIEVLFIFHCADGFARFGLRKAHALIRHAHVRFGFISGHVDFDVIEYLFHLRVGRRNGNGITADGNRADLDDLGFAALVKVKNIARLQIFYAFIRV